jgi:hypothetical protein
MGDVSSKANIGFQVKRKNCYELGVLCSKDDKRKGITTFFKKFVLMKVAKLFQRIEFRWAIEAGYL